MVSEYAFSWPVFAVCITVAVASLYFALHDHACDSAATWITQTWCGLRGHTEVLKIDKGIASMLCTHCRHESPGVQFSKARCR